ncbi:GHKL domain-containing protein [Megasphaera paucivorans]|uniref:GHKL domain-containing protein n=1 Tax=Megasphaera paucivorans TaxID=349095 RepID=A0A1H0C5L3_9FIRM|nr:GHKL domain-containing protein [Megasphaera paucivorans]SDN53153.1 GHKL domain-containing protein [Megasphaera paucivorans]
MNTFILLNFIRGLPTAFLLYVLLFTLAQPKYSRKINVFIVMLLVAIVSVIDFLFYQTADFTNLTKILIILYFIEFIVLKLFFKDNWLQWIFCYITVINLHGCVLIISFLWSHFLPYPYITTIFGRIFLLGVTIGLIQYYLKPQCMQLENYWARFSFVVVAICCNYIYYFLHTKDMVQDMAADCIPLLLLVSLTIVVYCSIFWAMKTIVGFCFLKTEKFLIEQQAKAFELQLANYNSFVEQARQIRHDLHHHNALLVQYLAEGYIEEAKQYLQDCEKIIVCNNIKRYCRNQAANAVFFLYASRIQELGVSYEVNTDIPENIPLTAAETGALLANVLENAMESCQRSFIRNCFIKVIAEVKDEKLFIQISNTATVPVIFENDMPQSSKEEGGIGTRSVRCIVEKYGGSLRFKIENNIFLTQIIIPL